jgi:hypothetical protein
MGTYCQRRAWLRTILVAARGGSSHSASTSTARETINLDRAGLEVRRQLARARLARIWVTSQTWPEPESASSAMSSSADSSGEISSPRS